jgi:hypothetical protein
MSERSSGASSQKSGCEDVLFPEEQKEFLSEFRLLNSWPISALHTVPLAG